MKQQAKSYDDNATTKHKQPTKFKAGAVVANVWENETDKGVYKTVSVQRNYMGKDKQWASTSSLRTNDVPKAILALQKAYEFIVTKPENADTDFDVNEETV